MKDNERFVCIYSQGGAKGARILVDTKTGVNYLYYHESFAAGFCPLLGADGKPVVSPEHIKK